MVLNPEFSTRKGFFMARKANLSDREFFKVCNKVHADGGTLDDIVAATGLSRSTVQSKRSALRGKGWPIAEFPRGVAAGSGGNVDHTPSDDDLKAIAEMTGKTFEQVKAESDATVKAVQERAAKIAAGRAANV